MSYWQRIADTARDAASIVVGWFDSLAAHVRSVRAHGLDARERRQVAVLAVLLVLGVAVCACVAVPIATLISSPENFETLLHDNYLAAVALYVLLNILHVFIAVIPGEPLELGAGFLFGTWGGLAVVSAGIGLGELFAFLLARHFGPRVVNLFVSQEKLDELVIFRNERRRNAIAFLMEFIPGTPKDIMPYILGLTPMRVSTWMSIALVARIPSILISTYVGAQFALGNYGTSALTFVVSLTLSVCGLGYYALITRQAKIAAAMDEVARREWEEAGGSRNDAATVKGRGHLA